MSDTVYDLGVRVGSSSDDAGLVQFESTLKRVLEDSATLSQSLKSLSEAFDKTDKEAKGAGTSTDKAGDQIRDAGKKAKESAEGMGFLEGSLRKLGEAFLALFAVQKVISYFKDSVTGAIEEDRAVSNLAEAMRSLAGATDEQVSSNEEFITTVEYASGIADDRLRGGMIRLLSATNDVTKSQDLLTVAAGAAARGQGDLDGNVTKLTMALVGGKVRGWDPFSIALRDAVKDGKITEEGARKLAAAYGDAGKNVHNAGIEVDRSTVAWQETKDAIGGTLQTVLVPLLPVLKGVGIFIGMVTAGVIQLGGAFARTGIMIVEGFTWALSLLPGVAGEFWEKIATKLHDTQQGILIGADDMAQQVMDGVVAANSAADAAMKGSKSIGASLAGAGRGKKGEGDGGEDKSEQERAKLVSDLAKSVLDLRQAETEEAKAALAAAEGKSAINAATKALAAAIGAEEKAARDALAVEQVAALQAVKATQQEKNQVAAINEKYRARELELEKRLAGQKQDVIEREKKALQAEKDAEISTAAAAGNKLAATAQTFRNRELQLERKYSDEKVKVTQEWAKKTEAIEKEVSAFKEKQDDLRLKSALKDIKLLEKAEEMADKKALKAMKKADAAEIKEKKREYDEMLRIMVDAGLKETDEYKALSLARQQIDKIEARNKLDTALGAISGVLGAASGAFAGMKAIAYAQDIIQTYLAATTAISAPPYGYGPTFAGYAAMAAAIITGLANAAKISSSEPKAAGGALFTSPTLSWVGEAGPELVLPYRFTRMFDAMSRDYARGGTTIHNTRNGPRVSINAPITTLSRVHGARVVEDLARKIDRAAPAVDRVKLSRPRVRRGSARRISP